MHVTRSFKSVAVAALTAVAATLALAGPMASEASAAAKSKTPAPIPATITPSVDTSQYVWNATTGRTNSPFVSFSWTWGTVTPATGETLMCSIDAGKVASTNNCSSPWAPGVTLAAGAHTFTLKASVKGSTYRSSSKSIPWTVDLTPPPAPAVDPVLPLIRSNTDATVTWTDPTPVAGDDSAATHKCQLLDTTTGVLVVPKSACQFNDSFPLTGLFDGAYTASVWAYDAENNESNAGTVSWTVDSSAPSAPVFDAAPPANTNSTTAHFAWHQYDTAPDGTKIALTNFTCALGGTPYTPCKSAGTDVTVSAGTYTFSVQGQDAAGNTAAATKTWTVFTGTVTTPVVTSGPPKNQTTDVNDANFYFGDFDPNVTYLCALDPSTATDPSAYVTCISPQPYLNLSDGTHTFYVEARDAGGNISAPSLPYPWTINTTPTSPVVVSAPKFDSGPRTYDNQSPPSFTWEDRDLNAALDQCSLDDGTTWTTCTSGKWPFSALVDGSHYTLSLRTGDTSSPVNYSSAVTWSWTYDATAPTQPQFSTVPPLVSNSTDATFSFASDLGTGFTCTLDALAPRLCASPVSFSNLSGGAHTFTVVASDAAGNTSSNTYSWSIDTSAPTAPTIVAPAPFESTSPAPIAWSDSDLTGNTVGCALDNVALFDCTSPVPVSGGTQGSHSFTVSVTNGTHTSKTTVGWVLDNTSPALTVDVPNYTSSTALVPTVSQTDANVDPSALTCALTGAATASDCGPYFDLPEGSYTLTVDTTDLAKNAAELVKSFVVDRTAPALTVNVPNFVASGSLAPDISQTDVNPGPITCSLAGPVSSGTCGPYSGLSDGAYTLTVDTTDAAGNAAVEAVRTWTVDTTAPVLSVTNVPSGTVSSTSVSPVVTQTDANPGPITCSLTGPTSASTCGPYSNLADGDYTLTATTTDLAGNVATRAVSSWKVNRLVTAPVAGPVDPAPTASLSTPTTLTGAATATFSETVHALAAGSASFVLTGTSTVVPTNVVCLSGSTVVACSGSFTAVRLTPRGALTPGQHYTVQVATGAVQDSAGNPSVANSSAFRASLGEQENSAAARAAWATAKATAAYGHSLVRQSVAGATASYTFKGTNITWWTVTGKDQGKATVYVDGVRKAYVDNYAAATHFKVARRYTKLANKTHTLRIVVRGLKGAKAGTGTFVSVDAFSVGKTRTNTPKLAMTWRSAVSRHYSAAHAAVARYKNETLSFTFRGTSVSWFTQRAVNQGKVAVYVDGVRKAIVDNYAAKTTFGVKRSVTRLTDTVHTLKLVVLGTHHKGATGTWVTVDRFQVT